MVLENIQTVCPVRGETIAKKESFTDYKGRRIYFCCPGCEEPFSKEPGKFLEKLGPLAGNKTNTHS
ncbi:MAG: YHS domain-containing protein [Acidobacteria bacterium]|nr:YHS domain-containing protein [Acidobacteriota bacterium]